MLNRQGRDMAEFFLSTASYESYTVPSHSLWSAHTSGLSLLLFQSGILLCAHAIQMICAIHKSCIRPSFVVLSYLLQCHITNLGLMWQYLLARYFLVITWHGRAESKKWKIEKKKTLSRKGQQRKQGFIPHRQKSNPLFGGQIVLLDIIRSFIIRFFLNFYILYKGKIELTRKKFAFFFSSLGLGGFYCLFNWIHCS